jgi:hypothetical protein
VAPALEALKELEGRALPGGELTIEPHESRIADHALRAADRDPVLAHPLWFVIASLRGMGISVDELCWLAGKRPADTLLYGTVEILQAEPLLVGESYRTKARITGVDRRRIRDGSTLDSVVVALDIFGDDGPAGTVTSAYLIKRAPA